MEHTINLVVRTPTRRPKSAWREAREKPLAFYLIMSRRLFIIQSSGCTRSTRDAPECPDVRDTPRDLGVTI
eukprot:3946913-Prymnesium_polylepis.1